MFLLLWLARRVLVFLLVLAVPVIAGEVVVRKLVGDAVAKVVKDRIGVSPSVGLGSSPVLLALIHGRLDTVTLAAKNARIGGLPPVTLSATLHDVHLSHLTSLQGAIGSIAVTAKLGPGAVRDLLATPACVESLPADLRASLTTVPRVLILPGRVDLLPPRGRAAEARLRPQAAAGTLVFHLSGLERNGAETSAAALAQASSRVDCSRRLPDLPFGISLASASAGSGTLALSFTGTNATFSALG